MFRWIPDKGWHANLYGDKLVEVGSNVRHTGRGGTAGGGRKEKEKGSMYTCLNDVRNCGNNDTVIIIEGESSTLRRLNLLELGVNYEGVPKLCRWNKV